MGFCQKLTVREVVVACVLRGKVVVLLLLTLFSSTSRLAVALGTGTGTIASTFFRTVETVLVSRNGSTYSGNTYYGTL